MVCFDFFWLFYKDLAILNKSVEKTMILFQIHSLGTFS